MVRSIILAPLPGSACLHAREGDFLFQKAVRNGVIMPVDIDMIVNANRALTPFAKLVGRGWQRLQSGALHLFEQLSAAGAKVACDAIIEAFRQVPDHLVQLAKREEAPPLVVCRQTAAGQRFRSRASIQRCTI